MPVTQARRYCQILRQYGMPRCLKLGLMLARRKSFIACGFPSMVCTRKILTGCDIYTYVPKFGIRPLLPFASYEQVLEVVGGKLNLVFHFDFAPDFCDELLENFFRRARDVDGLALDCYHAPAVAFEK